MLRTRKSLSTALLVTTATASLVGLGAGTAQAATSGGTASTFTVTSGALSITVPDGSVTRVALGSGAAGATSTGAALGAVSVTDARAALLAQWSVDVTTTDFARVGGTGTADETIAAAAVNYASGVVTGSGGTGAAVFTGSNAGTGTAAAIGTGTTAAALTLGVGNNSATWNPTISFSLLSSQVAGTYNGTITHSFV